MGTYFSDSHKNGQPTDIPSLGCQVLKPPQTSLPFLFGLKLCPEYIIILILLKMNCIYSLVLCIKNTVEQNYKSVITQLRKDKI